jgi:hypothetical protein
MSLKNDVKKDYFVTSATAENGSIVTVLGMRTQTSVKESIVIHRVSTTPGGKVLEESDEMIIPMTFDNQNGIRKEFYMGYSICHKDDVDKYDVDVATKLAEKRFSRPLVSYNFTYLNNDMCEALIANEVDYIVKNIDKYL